MNKGIVGAAPLRAAHAQIPACGTTALGSSLGVHGTASPIDTSHGDATPMQQCIYGLTDEYAVVVGVFEKLVDDSWWHTGARIARLANEPWHRSGARAGCGQDVDLLHRTGVAAIGGFRDQPNTALERRPVGLEAGDDAHGPYSEVRRPAEDLHRAGAARAGTDDDVAPAVTVEIADGDARSASGHSGAERREAL